MPVWLSARSDQLRYADPAWLLTVARGLTVMVWAVAIAVGTYLLSFAVKGLPDDPIIELAVVAYFIGAWVVATPDPGEFAGEPGAEAGSPRGLLRLTCGVIWTLGVVRVWLTTFGLSSVKSMDTRLLHLLMLAFVAGAEACKWRLIGELARRIPDGALVAASGLYARWVPKSLATLVGLSAVVNVLDAVWGTTPRWIMPVALAWLATLLGSLGAFALSVVTMRKVARAVRFERRFAVRSWGDADAVAARAGL